MTEFESILKITGNNSVRDLSEKRVSMPTCVLLKVTRGSRDDNSNDNSQLGGPYNFDYLTPYSLTARNSFCSVSGKLKTCKKNNMGIPKNEADQFAKF